MNNKLLTRPAVVAAIAAFCCLLWGSAVPFINLGYRLFAIDAGDTATQILFAGCRFFLAGLLTLAFQGVALRRVPLPRKGSWGRVAKLSMAQTVCQYVFFYIGVAHTTSVKASIIQGLNAFCAMMIACFVFRSEKMNGLKGIGGLLGVAGIVLVNLDGTRIDPSVSLQGEGFLILSMLASACSAGLIKRYGQMDDPVIMSGWQFAVGGAAMAACGFVFGGRLHPGSVAALGVLGYLAFLSAAAYSLWAVLLKVNPVSRVAVFMFLQPIFGVLLSLTIVDAGASVPVLRYGSALVLICLSILIVNRGQHAQSH